jgi:cystathionine gamma-synthase
MNFDTLCVHPKKRINDPAGAIATPIYQTATFAHPGLGESTGYDYTRQQNPTREQLEYVIAGLEGAADAIAFSSGMAAMSALMEFWEPGDHIVCASDLYGGTHRLFDHISKKNGLSFSAEDYSVDIIGAITDATKAIIIESPTNPTMRVFDIRMIAEAIRGKDILFVVDNTFLTPYFQQPLSLGADIALHSGSKFLGGHNDTIAGFLAVKDESVAEKLRFIAKTTGAALSPFDSFLIMRGIKTLAVRMERAQQNAVKIATWLESHPKISKVRYPGLNTHGDYDLSVSQTSGFGAMISFYVTDKDIVGQVLGRVKVISYAESLGGTESLITFPMLQTHADVPEADRLAKGIDDKLLRLSVGIESAEDLIKDLAQALSD